MEFSGLVNLIASPLGIVVLVLTLILLTQIREEFRIKWILLGLFGYFLTLYGYSDQWIKVPPPLVEPLQTLRTEGRNLSVLFLPLLVVVVSNFSKKVPFKIPRPVFYLIAIQVLLSVKTVMEGSMVTGILLFAAFYGIIFIGSRGVYQWLAYDKMFSGMFVFILVVGLLFSLGSFYQYKTYPYAVIFAQSRFLGTTGNPQHAAVILAITIPSIVYFFYKSKNFFMRAGWIAFALFIFYLLYLTGSRTGLLMATLGMLSIIFGNLQHNMVYIIVIFVVATIVQNVFPEAIDGLFGDDDNQLISRLDISTQENTRSRVWAIQWRLFKNNPLFGAPMTGDRFRFAENSWLAGAAAVGFLGFFFTLAFGISLIKRVVSIKNKTSLEYQSIRAGIIILIAGSFTEAYLLGNLSYPLLALSSFIVAADFLHQLENNRDLQAHIGTEDLLSYHR